MAYESLKKLQADCRKHNLSDIGTKAELTLRLKEKQNIVDPVLFSPRLTSKQKEDFFNPNPIVKSSSKPSDIYYIEVNQSNLFTYLNNAVIFPLAFESNKVYKEENRNFDLFTEYQNHIILATGLFSDLNPEQVYLEITANGLEINDTNNPNIFISENPIPISRISKIIFLTNHAKNFFLSNIKTFPDFGINAEICIVIDKFIPNIQTLRPRDLNISRDATSVDSRQLKQFDKVLGMFAFMKNAALFFADREGSLQEYSNGFFIALSLLNSSQKLPIYKESSLLKFLLFPKQIEVNSYQRVIFAKVIDYIYNDVVFDFQVAGEILDCSAKFSNIKEEEKTEILYASDKFQNLKDHLISYTDLLKDDTFKKNLPLLSLLILTKFSNKSKQHTDKQSVRNLFIQNAELMGRSATEFLLAILGLYYGYSQMVKNDTNLRFNDKHFEKIAPDIQSIKFNLKNYLERFVIETCFLFSTSLSQIKEDFNYLQANLSERINISPTRIGAFDYQIKISKILETDTFVIERVNLLDQITSMITETYPEGSLNNQYLTHYILNKIGLDKSAIIELLKRNASKISVEELASVVQFDRKNKGRVK